MHFFGAGSLNSFLAGMSDKFQVRRAQDRVIEVSLASLPRQPHRARPRRLLTPRRRANAAAPR